MYLLAKKLGLADRVFKNIKIDNGDPLAEDVLSEINRGGWSTGYTGQSPERLKAHLRNQHKFDPVTLRAPKDDPEVGGDYYGLPWPCWGTPDLRHPGTPILYNTNLHVMDGGGTFRARFGVEREVKLPDGTARKDNLLAEGSYSLGSEIKDGYPEFTYAVLKKLGWDKDLKPEEVAVIERIGGANPDGISWSTDLSGGIQRVALAHGCSPFGNAKARANAWSLPDPIPVHREPIYTVRAELVAKYPTRPSERQFRLPNVGFDVQKAAVEKGIAKQLPADPDLRPFGRIRRRRRRGTFQQVARRAAAGHVHRDQPSGCDRARHQQSRLGPCFGPGDAKRQSLPHEGDGHRRASARVSRGVRSISPAGSWTRICAAKYPRGTDPIVLGESVNTITTYGYDPATGMQETKATLCQVRAGLREEKPWLV